MMAYLSKMSQITMTLFFMYSQAYLACYICCIFQHFMYICTILHAKMGFLSIVTVSRSDRDTKYDEYMSNTYQITNLERVTVYLMTILCIFTSQMCHDQS